MLRERDMETARLYGFADHVEKFQAALYKIKGVEDVDFDLSGFLSDIPYVIFLPKYNVPIAAPDYFEQRRAMLTEIIRVATEFGMTRTEDRIEDYGAHWYIVTRLATEHYSKPVRYFSTQRPITPGSYPRKKDARRIVNYDKREYVQTIGRDAWGYIDYGCELDDWDVHDYELVREPEVCDA